MLTKETKDRIDRARQILVGQLPLPSDQIELITIALIYKFMDDMDEQSRDLGGQASFFTGKLRDYGWREIVANKLDAKERVDRFVKGIELLSEPKDNPVPDLFQSIFRNTFLKFRDGRTLKLFLDEINGFIYDHSEELGNAFEYLLDTMGTQADNGQFRTPRHIIDFIVDAVDPKLGQTILDPACGTAGFLISAFRHIIAAHTSNPEAGRGSRSGDQLTAEQRQQLTRDIVGYDITPQMARLSRVNMYLHQFASPVIHEYDTITNTARWDEKFDVILANPPFMSPHGGNQTHDKFRIAASRTEVLFADYILEHLLPDGRAGFIVPEGIIFQNNGDYVALRKWLIDEGGYGFPLAYQGKTGEEIPFLKVSDMNLLGNERVIASWNHSVSREVLRELKAEAYPEGTVIFPKIGAAIATNKKRILTRDSTFDNNVMGLIPNPKRLLPDYLHTYLLGFDISRWASESQPPSMRKTTVEAHKMPLPPVATQRTIVGELKREQATLAGVAELKAKHEARIRARLAAVWGEPRRRETLNQDTSPETVANQA